MKTLVIGASGATGKHLVTQLLESGSRVKAIVRSRSRVPEEWKNDQRIELIEAGISEITKAELSEYLNGCQAAASCLGHNVTFKGIFGKPRRLVTDAVKLLCSSVEEMNSTDRFVFVLMSTVGYRNSDIDPQRPLKDRIIISLLRVLIPPQLDNERAAEYLKNDIGPDHAKLDWVAVRPDSLIDEDRVTPYDTSPSLSGSVIFDSGKTSRINVGHFMAKLVTDEELRRVWSGRMPVIYNI